ncbi:hypothetical protein L7F22_065452 [Adiantum nelumboides]|nr:hypothetical protein [Adiantum nelumboides]MCO5611202.1 hypothetical protein [Adiantum nelumboides]
MHADVQHWCRSCHNCQVNGNKKLLYGPRQAVIANGPFEKWGIDAMGPLPRTANGKLYILVAIDYMTRWVEAQSVAKVNEKTVSKFVYTHICCRFGTPLEIVSDNGPGFRRGLLTEVCEELKISHRHSTPYYPQSNGLVEKANGIIAGIIRKMVESNPKRWDNFLDGAIWAYRITYRDATQFTPFHLVYGQEALQPIELNIPTIKLTGRQEQSNDEAWIDRLLNLVELEWKREAAYYCYKKKALQLKDKLNEGIKDKEIKEKSLVLRYNNALDNRFDAKFERKWEGPFIVKKAFTGGYYQLMDLNGKEHPRKVNGYRLKPYLSCILPAVFQTKQASKKTKKGSFMYAMIPTRPDIAFVVGVVSLYMSNSGKKHWEAVKGILRYLKATKNMCICYGSQELSVMGYRDSSYAGDLDNRRSMLGYVFKMARGAVSWRSRLQTCVTQSTTEAEYVAASEACKEAIWLGRLVTDLGIKEETPMLHCDSQSAIQLARNPVYHSKTKHVDVKYHFIREMVEDKQVQLVKVHTTDYPTDLLTKGLPGESFAHCRKLLSVG